MRALLALLLVVTQATGPPPYAPAMSGTVEGYRLAGIEPDGDPLDQVVLSTTLSPSGNVPKLHLVINAYLENFKPDTTPILPDLLHQNKTATNLGGFLNGKALITDGAGNLLYTGAFLAEAFLNNTNHTVMRLYGLGAAKNAGGSLKGSFVLSKGGGIRGSLTGRLTIPPAARAQIARNQGKKMPGVQQIVGLVTVKPHAMMGRSTHSNAAPLHTGYATPTPIPSTSNATPSPPQRRISPVTIVAGTGAIICLIAAIVLWWWQRRSQSARERT